MAASKPDDTRTSSGLNCSATGISSSWKAKMYSASPMPPIGHGKLIV